MTRIRAIGFTVTVISVATLILFGLHSSLFTSKAEAQAQTQLVPLVTDQTPLALPNVVGMGGGGVVNQAGDFAFFGGGGSAVFYRHAGAAALTRVMQMGDEVPGFPGSRADIIQAIKLNNSGVIVFRPDIFQTNGVIQGAIFTFDGTSLHQVVSGNDAAPGGGGAIFGRTLNVAGLNDSGDIAFTAPLVAPNSVLPTQTTLYIAPGGGTPVRIAGVGDTAPGIAGGTISTLTALGFNNVGQQGFSNTGEELFSATVTVPGPATVQAFFVGSIAGGVRKLVATGDARPEGGVFPAPTLGLMNNAGQVAFQAGGIYINSLANGTSQTVAVGDAVPAPPGGNLADAGSLLTFDDAGDVVFSAGITNVPASNNFGLFRFRPANPPTTRLEVVAYRGQAAAGAAGESFTTGFTVSINSTGVVSFRATLTGGPILNGIFQQTGTNAPVNIALDGQATTLAGGGTYSLPFVSIQTLNDGSVYFRTDVVGGAADYAEVLVLGGVTKVLMNTADPLQAGARVSLRSFRVGAAGNFVGFLAQRAGGPFSIALHNITTQATSVLVSDRDVAPGTGGGLIRIATRNTVFLNAGGSAVFAAQLIGGSAPGSQSIFLASPGGALTKVAVNGDVVSGTGGKTLSGITFTQVTPSPINDAGQVVFVANLVTPITLAITRTVCVWSPGTGLARVAAVGEVPSTGGTAITSFPGGISLSINSAAQVAFGATTAGGPAGILGIFVGSPGGSFAKVVAAGDPGPSGGAFASFVTPSFNDSGEVAFMATLTGGPGGGVFVGSTSAAPIALALNGAAAPAGGNFSITAARPDVVINNQHDVAFRGDLTGGSSDSGFFIRRGPAGPLLAPVLQGQPAPGTTGVFDTAATSVNNLVSENIQLGPNGDLAFQTFFLAGGLRTIGLWHLKTDNTIEEIIVRGTVAPEFGGGTAVSLPSTAWNSGGRYPVWAGVSGGTFTDAIFLFVPTVGTTTPAGTNVPVTLTDATTGTTPVSMNFDSITSPGVTSLTTSSGGPAIPAAFALGDPPVFYNLETTATFSGSVGVCIDFGNVSFPAGSTLRMLHFQGGAWVDVTTSGPTGSVICGSVTSLSPFTVAKLSPTASGSEITGTIKTADGTPLGGVAMELAGTTTAFTITDSVGHYRFADLAARGFYTVTPQLVNYAFSPGARSFSLVGNKTEAVFTATLDDVARANPLDTPEFFVRQQYLDFLGREPDQAGLAYWVEQINGCNGDAGCIRARRIAVSNAFFQEQEYQRTGSYVFRLYRAAFGNSQAQPNPDNSNPTEAQKLPSYSAFSADRGRVIGGATLAQSQLDLANAFVQRREFADRYPADLDGPGFVDALLATIRNDSGADLSSQRQALLELFNAGGRGNVLYRLADDHPETNSVDNRAFIDLEYNRAFVFTEYAGYLRRDADIDGFLFWLGQVNRAPLSDISKQHAMVCSFLSSDEYQFRFGSVRTQSNADCH